MYIFTYPLFIFFSPLPSPSLPFPSSFYHHLFFSSLSLSFLLLHLPFSVSFRSFLFSLSLLGHICGNVREVQYAVRIWPYAARFKREHPANGNGSGKDSKSKGYGNKSFSVKISHQYNEIIIYLHSLGVRGCSTNIRNTILLFSGAW
jgi:hypothetical protein